MSAQEPLTFKFATEDWEFEQIHRLNYKTFVEEIPQHHPSPTQRLVDRFHAENTYLIGLQNRKLVGMLAVRGTPAVLARPETAQSRFPSAGRAGPSAKSGCLPSEKKFRGARGGQVLQGILALLWQHGVEKGLRPRHHFRHHAAVQILSASRFRAVRPGRRQRGRAVPADVRHARNVRGHRPRISALVARALVSAQRGEFSARARWPCGAKCAARSSRRRNRIAPIALKRTSHRPDKFSANWSAPGTSGCSWVPARWPTTSSPGNYHCWADMV